jgi:ABC-type siderophore export system fused ATPase/permease subunit
MFSGYFLLSCGRKGLRRINARGRMSRSNDVHLAREVAMAADHNVDYGQERSDAQRRISHEEKDAQILLKTQLVNWTVRAIVSFLLVGVVFYLTPNSGWLWWGAVIVAALSLVYILALAVISRRRIAADRARLSAAEEFAKCLEEAQRRAN